MMALLSPRLWAALALSVFLIGSHWKAYVMGGNAVQADWTAAKLAQADADAKANDAARAKEQESANKLRKANDAYQIEKKRRLAAAAQLDSGLRDFRATLYDIAPKDAAATGGANGAGIRDVLAECAATATDLAGQADRLSGKVTGLQDYIKSVVP